VAVIELRGLRKEYARGRTTAIAGLDLDVPEGGVFGFLGPNGSGKTTTIRCILGLVRPTGGRATMLGADVPKDLARVVGKVGSIVETPALFPAFSARRNLELLGSLEGIGPSAVAAMLQRVGLGGREDDPVRAYSLGMRQRLGLAAALLKDPALLILDEPANGLDPEGIQWIRTMLKELAAEGRTVFVSSHLMSEMALTAEHLIVVGRGKLIRDISVSDFIAAASDNSVHVRSPQAAQLRDLLLGTGVTIASSAAGELDVTGLSSDEIGTRAAAAGITLYELAQVQASLEEAFMELTADSVEYRAITAPRTEIAA
jgi:ABC-2 type transport system ATP-binding protein